MHEQVWTKVKVKVDKDISELVEAINLLPEICTTSSCQGDGLKPSKRTKPILRPEWAWIFFSHKSSEALHQTKVEIKQFAEFIFCGLCPQLKKAGLGIGDSLLIRLYMNGWGIIVGEMGIHPDLIKKTTQVFKTIIRDNKLK